MSKDPASVVRSMWAAFSRGDIDAAEAHYAADCIEHSVSPAAIDGVQDANERRRRSRRRVLEGWPGLRVEVVQTVIEGETVVARSVVHQRHSGEFLGLAPTGRETAVDRIDIFRLRDGLIAEHWSVVDELKVFRTLGLIKENSNAQ
jgi:predicted ester cyclase